MVQMHTGKLVLKTTNGSYTADFSSSHHVDLAVELNYMVAVN